MKYKFIVIILLMLTSVINAHAFESRYFNLDLPAGYEITTQKDGTYQWVNETKGSNYVMSVKFRDESKSILNYTKEDLSTFVSGMVESLKAQYSENYNTTVDVTLIDSGLGRFNNYDSIYIKVGINNFLSTGKNMNQYIYVMETKNLMYSLVYSTFSDSYDESEFAKIENSLKLKDELNVGFLENFIEITVFIILNMSIGFLIALIINKYGIFKKKG